MARPPDPCPACHAPTRKAYRPNILDPGDVEPFEWCTACAWDTDTVTALPIEMEHHENHRTRNLPQYPA